MTQLNQPNPSERPQPLDYGFAERKSTGWWRRLRGGIAERVAGFWVFAGQMVALVGEIRQLIFAVGFATLAGGLGICLERGFDTSGPCWMWFGGFVVGVCVPVPKRR